MPRGGGRFGGGGRNQGPEHWEDEDGAPIVTGVKPAPTFPEIHLPIPRPLDHTEVAAVNRFLRYRGRTRNGTFFANLEPSSLTDDKGRVAPRAGFDPFNDQEAYASRFQKKKRSVPDVTSHKFALQLFPRELWSVIDPERKHPIWATIPAEELEQVRARKRKRRTSATGENADENEGQAASDEDSDVPATDRRTQKMAKSRKGDADSKQRRGLDAEDDYPEDNRDVDDDGDGEDEPQDSEFEESEDEENDYNAEGYFSGGEDADMDDDGGGDAGGGDYY